MQRGGKRKGVTGCQIKAPLRIKLPSVLLILKILKHKKRQAWFGMLNLCHHKRKGREKNTALGGSQSKQQYSEFRSPIAILTPRFKASSTTARHMASLNKTR